MGQVNCTTELTGPTSTLGLATPCCQVQEYVRHTMRYGLAINTSVVIATGCRMVMNQDANQLSINGGGIKLTDK